MQSAQTEAHNLSKEAGGGREEGERSEDARADERGTHSRDAMCYYATDVV